MIRLRPIREQDAAALEQLQIDCYPTLGASELMREEHFLRHCRVFPEGDIVALDDDRVVGLGSGFLIDFDFDHPEHRFNDIISGGFYERHDPDGQWYYGADISVHPRYRGRGIGKLLYDARKALVRRLGRRGIVAGGVLPGYARQRAAMSVPEYVERVVAGELADPTLSFQLRQGFEVRGLLRDYIDDSASDGWATLLVWENDSLGPDSATGTPG